MIDLRPAHDLNGPQLAELVAELAREEGMWRDLVRHDPRARVYEEMRRSFTTPI